jgi:hypothetical protein
MFPYTIRYHSDRINYLFQNNRHYISSFSIKKTLYIVVISRIQCEFARNSLEAEISVAGSETGSGVGAETSLKVGSGSGIGSETNHSGSKTLA